MHVFQDAYNASDLPRGGVGTIGNFDGVHRGQRAILEQLTARAEELGVPAVVITFDPHPLTVLSPERAPIALTTPKQKEELLEKAGVSVMLVVRFTPELSRVPARTFVREFLHDRLDLKDIFVGAGFTFGHKREGNLEMLQEMGRELGFSATPVDEVVYAGEDAVAPLWTGRRFPIEQCISGLAMIERRPIYIPDIYRDARVPQDLYRPTFVASMAMFPLGIGDPIAALGVYWAKDNPAEPDALALLDTLARSANSTFERLAIAREIAESRPGA